MFLIFFLVFGSWGFLQLGFSLSVISNYVEDAETVADMKRLLLCYLLSLIFPASRVIKYWHEARVQGSIAGFVLQSTLFQWFQWYGKSKQLN